MLRLRHTGSRSIRFSGSANAAFLIFMPCPTEQNAGYMSTVHGQKRQAPTLGCPSSPSEAFPQSLTNPPQDAACVTQIARC